MLGASCALETRIDGSHRRGEKGAGFGRRGHDSRFAFARVSFILYAILSQGHGARPKRQERAMKTSR